MFIQRFSAPVGMWDMHFSPHALHGSMLEATGCGCENMYRLFFFSTTTCKEKQLKIVNEHKDSGINQTILSTDYEGELLDILAPFDFLGQQFLW